MKGNVVHTIVYCYVQLYTLLCNIQHTNDYYLLMIPLLGKRIYSIILHFRKEGRIMFVEMETTIQDHVHSWF